MMPLPEGTNRPDVRAPDKYSGPEHYNDPKRPRQSYWVRVAISLTGSAAATGIARTVTAPLERVKLILQSQPLYGTYPIQPPVSGLVEGCKRIYDKEGATALFRGNGINCLRILPTTFLRFALFDRAKSALLSSKPQQEAPPDLAAPGPVLAVSNPKLIPVPQIIIPNAEYPRGENQWMRHMRKDRSENAASQSTTDENVKMLKETARGISIRLAAGALSGTVTLALVYPMDTLHTVLTADTTPKGHPRLYTGIFNCAVKFVKHDGLFALYKGLTPSWLGAMLYSAVSFTAYDTLMYFAARPSPPAKPALVFYDESLQPRDRQRPTTLIEPSVFLKFTLGVTAGLLGQSLTYPLDTIRRRLQLHHALGMRQDIKYNGMLDCWRQMVRFEPGGYKALYRGIMINALKTSVCAGIQFVVYDYLQGTILDSRYRLE